MGLQLFLLRMTFSYILSSKTGNARGKKKNGENFKFSGKKNRDHFASGFLPKTYEIIMNNT